jgi:pyochelin biosynthetic protein PchC
VCLPHAGGTASFFRSWTPQLPPGVELRAVCYPGRQDRLDEPCIERMDVLADRVTEALAPLLDRPLALFGHSMGASVAYEVAQRLEAGGFCPTRLFVSGREAPHRTRIRDTRHRTDEELVREVRALGEVDQGVLDDPDLRELILPALRADYRLIDDYRPERPEQIKTPIMAYAGISDPGCAIDAARAWSDLTTGGFQMRIFPGDHFFLVPAEAELVSDLSQRLT